MPRTGRCRFRVECSHLYNGRMELEPGIHQITVGKAPLPGFPAPNAFLVFGTETAVFIDTGWESEEDHRQRMTYLKEVNAPPVAEIIITHRHPDHGGGALHMHRELGAPMACHPNDREVIERDRLHGETAIAVDLQGGDRRELGGLSLEVLHAPGHTMGSVALLVPERQALFTSDTVMAVSTTSIGPQDGNLAEYMKTLELFEQVDARIMYPGHGGPVKRPAVRLKNLIRHRHEREQAILVALADGPLTPHELRMRIYRRLPESRVRLAERQLVTTLNKLIDEQAVTEEEAGKYALL